MAKSYYNLEETGVKLGCTETQVKALVRDGKLREFRDAGKLNYRIEEVDELAAKMSAGSPPPGDSGELLLEDSGEIPLAPLADEGQPTPSDSDGVPVLGDSDSDEAVDLSSDSGVGSGLLSLDSGSGDFQLDGSGGGTAGISLEDSGGGSDAVQLSDSGGSDIKLEDSGAPAPSPDDSGGDSGSGSGAGDIVSLDEVDKDAVEGMKKDDTVITNIGISVFDDDDLEIAADPMAKTLMTGGDEHLGLDGSGGGSGLLDLTRESDDTSLGAELLEGIDMGDTADTVATTASPEPATPADEEDAELPEPELEPVIAPVAVQFVGVPEAASPAFTGLLIAGTLVLGLSGAANIATSLDAWPAYLAALSENFWILLAGGVGVGIVFALAGWLVQMSGSRPPKRAKPRKKAKKTKKGGPGANGAAPEIAG